MPITQWIALVIGAGIICCPGISKINRGIWFSLCGFNVTLLLAYYVYSESIYEAQTILHTKQIITQQETTKVER